MNIAAFFITFVGCITLLTTARLISEPSLFLVACVTGQAIAMYGLLTNDQNAIHFSHVCFTCLLWLGALTGRDFECFMVLFLAAFTLTTRHALGYCMFAHARGSTDTNDVRYDILYVFPLFIALYHLTPPCA